MKIIGLTGGIGSGKSTVANEFKSLGVPVFIADDASKRLMATDQEVIKKVISLLGEEAYDFDHDEGFLPNKKYIARKVFNDKKLLTSLNAIMHPAVRNYFKEWVLKQNYPYLIYEAAILFESSSHKLCHQVILVTVNKEERIRRVMSRDNVSREQVMARIQNQWTDKEKLEFSDFVIINDNLQKIPAFVKSIHEVLLK
jgi:dephospho-CoA kinase